jgi:hypothetical protein
VWHYAIVGRTLLFDLKVLKLMTVKIARSAETLTIAARKIAADRFDFSGDWTATACSTRSASWCSSGTWSTATR